MQKSKNIHTTIPYGYWFKAQIKGISWSEALKVGIELIAGVESNKEEELIREINTLSRELTYKQKKLLDLRDVKNKQEEQDSKKELARVRKESASFKRFNPARYL